MDKEVELRLRVLEEWCRRRPSVTNIAGGRLIADVDPTSFEAIQRELTPKIVQAEPFPAVPKPLAILPDSYTPEHAVVWNGEVYYPAGKIPTAPPVVHIELRCSVRNYPLYVHIEPYKKPLLYSS